jgi:hypothetical protein
MANIKNLDDLNEFIKTNNTSQIATFHQHAEIGSKLPPVLKIWGDFILEQSLVHFPSRRGLGKSLLCLQIGLAVSNRYKEFLGLKIEKPGVVLFCDFEMSPTTTSRRAFMLKKNAPSYDPKYSDDFIILNSQRSFKDEFININQIIDKNRPVLVILDNLVCALANTDPNNGTNMSVLFSLLNGMKQHYGCSIVVIDHLRKHTDNKRSESDLQSGSGVKTNLSDADFMLRGSYQDISYRILLRIKSRLVEESNIITLIRLNHLTLWFEFLEYDVNEADHILGECTDINELKDKAKHLLEMGLTQRAIATSLGKSPASISRYLNKD